MSNMSSVAPKGPSIYIGGFEFMEVISAERDSPPPEERVYAVYGGGMARVDQLTKLVVRLTKICDVQRSAKPLTKLEKVLDKILSMRVKGCSEAAVIKELYTFSRLQMNRIKYE
jgi:hypothetical protein